MKNKKLREQMKSYIIVTLACVLYALSFDWFYAPNGFTVGGFTGISQIINFFAPILPVGTMVIVLNVPLFIVGLKKFGFAFLCKSIYTMTLSSILIDVVAAIHEFAPMDPLLACLYGGVTLGIASGLLFREETTTGGSELGAWIVRSHVERLSIGNICLGIDLTIILIYAAVFHSLNNALYGALALYITTKVLDLVVYGQNTAKVAYIISDRAARADRQHGASWCEDDAHDAGRRAFDAQKEVRARHGALPGGDRHHRPCPLPRPQHSRDGRAAQDGGQRRQAALADLTSEA